MSHESGQSAYEKYIGWRKGRMSEPTKREAERVEASVEIRRVDSLGNKLADQRTVIAELVTALVALLKMVREDEASPVMHDENCSAWCHYRPVLEQCDAALAQATAALSAAERAKK